MSSIMRPLMASVPDDDFKAIADWLSTLKYPRHPARAPGRMD